MGYGVKTTSTIATSMEVINILQEILLEAGWSKTSDTGQWDGVTAFTSTSEYVMWAMPTDGGTLDPVVLKIRPNDIDNATRPTFTLAIGKASDGAGTITGTSWEEEETQSFSSYEVTYRIYYAYDDGGVVICGNKLDNLTGFFILIERKRTPSGAPVNGALATMFFQASADSYNLPATILNVRYGLGGISVFATNNFAKTWGAQQISSPIADNPTTPKSSDGLTAPSQPVMFFGPNACWYSNLILVVQPSEGGTAMQAVVNGSPRYYRTVQTDVRTLGSIHGGYAYPIAGTPNDNYTNTRTHMVPSILNQ